MSTGRCNEAQSLGARHRRQPCRPAAMACAKEARDLLGPRLVRAHLVLSLMARGIDRGEQRPAFDVDDGYHHAEGRAPGRLRCWSLQRRRPCSGRDLPVVHNGGNRGGAGLARRPRLRARGVIGGGWRIGRASSRAGGGTIERSRVRASLRLRPRVTVGLNASRNARAGSRQRW